MLIGAALSLGLIFKWLQKHGRTAWKWVLLIWITKSDRGSDSEGKSQNAEFSISLLNMSTLKKNLYENSVFPCWLDPNFGPRFEQAMQKKSELKVIWTDMDMTAQWSTVPTSLFFYTHTKLHSVIWAMLLHRVKGKMCHCSTRETLHDGFVVGTTFGRKKTSSSTKRN